MPKLVTYPTNLKPFIFHGVNLLFDAALAETAGYQARGDCPFCGREGKFYVAVETGKWDCKRCGAAGNPVTFLRQLWEQSRQQTGIADYTQLAANRGYVSPGSLVLWGAALSILSGEWIVPGYGADGSVNNLYRYMAVDGRLALLPTVGIPHQLYGVHLFDPAKPTVYVCEGFWDCVALAEVFRCTARIGQGTAADPHRYAYSIAESTSLHTSCNIVGMPTCSVTPHACLSLFSGKQVVILPHNDYPLRNHRTGQQSPPAAWAGAKRLVKELYAQPQPPQSVRILMWGPEGYDKAMKHGYDVRDELSPKPTLPARATAMASLLAKVRPVPQAWTEVVKTTSAATSLVPMPCQKWADVIEAWTVKDESGLPCMRWFDGLDRALACMFATVTSTMALGDQLWMKIVGPASTGKTTLCEALAVSKEYILSRSIIRGMHSGMRFQEGEDDASLIAQSKGKTLVIKDADTLLQAPNLLQILSELRDLYDTSSRTQYRNQVSHIYEGHRMTVLLCGTPSIRQLDSSDLGERFLDCVIMDSIDPVLEEDILLYVARRSARDMSFEANGDARGQYHPFLSKAMCLTGGYVEYLRKNAQKLLNTTTMSETALKQCMRLAQFVAYMRARPSKKQDETAEREFAARLTSQLVRLAKCLAVVLNVKHIVGLGESSVVARTRPGASQDVMRRVRHVALDTSRGKTFDLAARLYDMGETGMVLSWMASILHVKEEKAKEFLVFLRRIQALEWYIPCLPSGQPTNITKWRLTPRLSALYKYAIIELGNTVSEVES